VRRIISARGQRSFLAMLMTAAAVTALGAVGGIGAGGGSVASAQYQYGKVTICHVAGQSGNRVTITVAASAVPAHLDHGDTLGPCR
jgi:ABC-type sugar transport system substrate-binding protein